MRPVSFADNEPQPFVITRSNSPSSFAISYFTSSSGDNSSNTIGFFFFIFVPFLFLLRAFSGSMGACVHLQYLPFQGTYSAFCFPFILFTKTPHALRTEASEATTFNSAPINIIYIQAYNQIMHSTIAVRLPYIAE